jgi:GTP pyrophosphokinase
VYVNSPKGEVIELPEGATPLDFAYRIHSDIGHRCVGAKVNGNMVPLRYHLQHGDVVEVLTSNRQTPHIDWLEIVVTGRARTRIRQKLRDIDELPTVGPGESRTVSPPQPFAKPEAVKSRRQQSGSRSDQILIEGHRDMEVSFAKCCNPQSGDPVIGYITKRQGITVHKPECRLLEKSGRSSDRMVAASWDGMEMVEASIKVRIGSRPNALMDITSAIKPLNVDILQAEFKTGTSGVSVFEFIIQTTDRDRVERVKKSLAGVPGVRRVFELSEAEMVVGK